MFIFKRIVCKLLKKKFKFKNLYLCILFRRPHDGISSNLTLKELISIMIDIGRGKF